MKQDMVVIPLRVPREVGRSWKLEAVKQDKSVQRWILDRLEFKSKGVGVRVQDQPCQLERCPPDAPSHKDKPSTVSEQPKSPFKFTESTCPGHNFVNVGGLSKCMNCGVSL